jgi:chromosome segregation ATPase
MTSHAKRETIENDLEACNEQLAEMTRQRDAAATSLALSQQQVDVLRTEVIHLQNRIAHYQSVLLQIRRWCNKISNYSAKYWLFPWRTLNDINDFVLDLRDALETDERVS